MRRLALILAFVSVLFAPLAAQEKDGVIYPRGTAPAGAPAGPGAGGSNTLFLLGAAVVAAAGGWWLWQKRRMGAAGIAGSARLAIVESKPLGSRQYLVVADYDGRKFLLGVCPGSIEMLTPLDGGQPPTKS
ncbi:MAG TPA: flagellar biosynthetic protein FliO [Lacunisphaera sp.]